MRNVSGKKQQLTEYPDQGEVDTDEAVSLLRGEENNQVLWWSSCIMKYFPWCKIKKIVKNSKLEQF